MGQLNSRLFRSSNEHTDTIIDGDPDEKWSNIYREREKNHLYKWVGVREGKQNTFLYNKYMFFHAVN